VRPVQELKAYKRISLNKQEKVNAVIAVPQEAFCYYDQKMVFDLHDGDYTVQLGTSCNNILKTFEVKVRNKKLYKATEMQK
jgi:hypothetical protein